MIEQVQCSNPACGSYKVVVSSRSFENPQSHKSLSEFGGVGCLVGFIVWAILWIIISSASGSPGSPTGWIGGVGIWVALIIGIIVTRIVPAIRRAQLKASAISVYHMYCNSCGKRWEERRYPN